jgi:1,4-dihydroxy-2-naphthoate octaprenyltransferase
VTKNDRKKTQRAPKQRQKDTKRQEETVVPKAALGGFTLFVRAVRAQFLPLSVLAVLIGGTLPFWLRPDGWSFSPWLLVEAVIGVLFLGMGANLGNGYYDYLSGADVDNPASGTHSGGSGLITEGLLPASFFLRWSMIFLALGALVGLHLSLVVGGWFVPVIGLVGLFLAHFYTAPPIRLAYRGLGELTVALAFGVLPVAGSYYLQTGAVSWRVLLASLPITFAVVLVLWVNELVDIEPDRRAGKMNLAVRMGHRAAGRAGVLTLSVLVFASLFAAVFTASLIPLTLVAVLAFGLIRTVVVDCWKYHGQPRNLREAQSSAIRLHLTLGVIIAGSALAAVGS